VTDRAKGHGKKRSDKKRQGNGLFVFHDFLPQFVLFSVTWTGRIAAPTIGWATATCNTGMENFGGQIAAGAGLL
jgi:hypothetical protein